MIAPCLHAAIHAPQSIHIDWSRSTTFFRVNAPTGHASTQPTHAPPHLHELHLPSFQQHLV